MKYFKLLGIALFIYILSQLDYKIVVETVLKLNIFYLFLYAVSFFTFFILKAYRWHLIQNYFSKPLKFSENFWVIIETLYLSFVTPGRFGDIARAWIIKKYFNIDKKDTILAYIFDRIQDVLFLIIFTLYGLLVVIKIKISSFIYIGLIAFIFLYLFKNRILNLIKSKFILIENIQQTDFGFEVKIFAINIVVFFFYFLQLYFLAKAMHLDISYSFVIALVSISAIATLIPISVNGLGVREGVFIYLLSTINISKEAAVILSLLDNVVFMALFIIILHIFSKFYLRGRLEI